MLTTEIFKELPPSAPLAFGLNVTLHGEAKTKATLWELKSQCVHLLGQSEAAQAG